MGAAESAMENPVIAGAKQIDKAHVTGNAMVFAAFAIMLTVLISLAGIMMRDSTHRTDELLSEAARERRDQATVIEQHRQKSDEELRSSRKQYSDDLRYLQDAQDRKFDRLVVTLDRAVLALEKSVLAIAVIEADLKKLLADKAIAPIPKTKQPDGETLPKD
jgi:hypothetical protein